MFLGLRQLERLREEKRLLIRVSATKIQAAFRAKKARGRVAARRVAYNFAAQEIQRIWRAKTARRKHRAERQMVTKMQAWIRRFVWRTRFFKARCDRAEEMQKIIRDVMGELGPLVYSEHLFADSVMSADLDKLKTMVEMTRAKQEIRYLYLKFSTHGVGHPSKAFKMTKTQF